MRAAPTPPRALRWAHGDGGAQTGERPSLAVDASAEKTETEQPHSHSAADAELTRPAMTALTFSPFYPSVPASLQTDPAFSHWKTLPGTSPSLEPSQPFLGPLQPSCSGTRSVTRVHPHALVPTGHPVLLPPPRLTCSRPANSPGTASHTINPHPRSVGMAGH